MASTNVELVRSIYAAWERGDFFGSAEWAHPEIEFVIADGPEPGRWTGVAEMAEAWRDFLQAWEGAHPNVEGYRELDDERVLVLIEYSGSGKASGLSLTRARGATLFHIRGDKVARLVVYFDRERALGDLGLEPEPESTRP